MPSTVNPGAGRLWNALPRPGAGLRCVVVMPVRNEAAYLDASLLALAAQRGPGGVPFDRNQFEILLLANNCDDHSAARARGFAAARPGLQLHVAEVALGPEQANVGYVRGCLMDEACRRLEQAGGGERVIVSTDGDTRVAEDWLLRTLQAIDAGADAVGGRILTDGCELPSAPALRLRRLDEAHSLLRSRLASLIDPEPHDPWPRHHQHFGASLAVTAAAYRLVGGLPYVPFLEDEALVRALRRHDLRVRHSPAVRVTTSSRLDGRAAVGLSWQLRQWAEGSAEPAAQQVESPQRFAVGLAARRALREWWLRGGRTGQGTEPLPQRAADQLGLGPAQVLAAFRDASHFGAAWESIERLRDEAATASDRVALPQAVAALHRLVAEGLGRPVQGVVKTSTR